MKAFFASEAVADSGQDNVLGRFLRYVKTDTQSDPASETYPSTQGQLVLLKMLAGELAAMGLADVEMDEYGYVTATIPATTSKKVPVIGFIAHVDTSSDVSGTDVKPQVVKYTGGDIIANSELGIILSEEELKEYRGQTLVTTDGTTLLGADDKAGVAEIMTAASYLISHPQVEHGTIRIAFTPDEEIGKGVDHFDVEKFGARYAYTIDGGALGSFEYETFNAAEAHIEITGYNTHPGAALGKMVNAQSIAFDIDRALPQQERPEFTSGRQGFFHLTETNGDVELCKMHYIIRDHDNKLFERKKQLLTNITAQINKDWGAERIKLDMHDQYYNMREKIEPHPEVISVALEAMKQAGVMPVIDAVRGGTDGSRLSYMGLPCPNIFSGAENMHSRKEFVNVEVMERAVEVIVNIGAIFCSNILDN